VKKVRSKRMERNMMVIVQFRKPKQNCLCKQNM
jgi:hypothetical protein